MDVERNGTIRIGDLALTVHVLSDGKRVIPDDDLLRALRWLETNQVTEIDLKTLTAQLRRV